MNTIKKIVTLSKIFLGYKRKKLVLNTMPIRLWVESSLACNLKCVMCPNKEIPQPNKGIMDFELFKKIIDEAKDFVNDIFIHHRGEPMLNPRGSISSTKMYFLAGFFRSIYFWAFV